MSGGCIIWHPISVKHNLKIEANVGVSECTVCYRLVQAFIQNTVGEGCNGRVGGLRDTSPPAGSMGSAPVEVWGKAPETVGIM